MTDPIPSFPYAPFSIPDEKGMVNTQPTPKGVATVDDPRRMAKDLNKMAKAVKGLKKLKAPLKQRKKLGVKWY